MPGEGLADILGGQCLYLVEKQLQMIQRQAVETDHPQLGDNGGIVRGA